MTDPVKAKLIELVPEIRREGRICPAQHAEGFKIDCWYCEEGKNLRPITLADVLRAIQTQLTKYDDVKIYVGKDSAELIFEHGTYDGEGDTSSFVEINLALDFDNQTQEVKDFIGKLINAY